MTGVQTCALPISLADIIRLLFDDVINNKANGNRTHNNRIHNIFWLGVQIKLPERTKNDKKTKPTSGIFPTSFTHAIYRSTVIFTGASGLLDESFVFTKL